MTIEEILTQLKTDDFATFPLEALQAASLQQEEITPALLDIVEGIANNPQLLGEGDNPDCAAFIYALFLLAQFKEQRAYPAIVQYFAQLGPEVEALDATGDVVTEDLQRILASVCPGDLNPIKQLIDNPNINEYVRAAALETLVVLYNEDQLTRDELIGYLNTLINKELERAENTSFLTLVMCSCDKIYPNELHEALTECFKRDLIDTFMIDEQDIIKTLSLEKEQVLAELKQNPHYRFIDSAITAMEWWACFHPEPEPEYVPKTKYEPPVLTHPKATAPVIDDIKAPNKIKLGRNEPCFCGSGKKYKKCCLNA